MTLQQIIKKQETLYAPHCPNSCDTNNQNKYFTYLGQDNLPGRHQIDKTHYSTSCCKTTQSLNDILKVNQYRLSTTKSGKGHNPASRMRNMINSYAESD